MKLAIEYSRATWFANGTRWEAHRKIGTSWTKKNSMLELWKIEKNNKVSITQAQSCEQQPHTHTHPQNRLFIPQNSKEYSHTQAHSHTNTLECTMPFRKNFHCSASTQQQQSHANCNKNGSWNTEEQNFKSCRDRDIWSKRTQLLFNIFRLPFWRGRALKCCALCMVSCAGWMEWSHPKCNVWFACESFEMAFTLFNCGILIYLLFLCGSNSHLLHPCERQEVNKKNTRRKLLETAWTGIMFPITSPFKCSH